MRSAKNFLILLSLFLIASEAFSVPVDWHGQVQFDTNFIDTFRRSESKSSTITPATDRTIGFATDDTLNASFQTYTLRLSPSLIINDAISLYAELSTGYGNGGLLGNGSKVQSTGKTFGNALYYHNNSSENLNLTQYYLELYSDTATYKIGQHSYNWGMGALYSTPKYSSIGRHQTIRNGFTATLKLGNFIFEPFWSKINQGDNLTGTTDTTEYGISASYDNIQQDFYAGILYSVKDMDVNSTFLSSASTNATIGESKIKVLDIYFNKKYKNLTVSAEIPIFSGNLGKVFSASANTNYDAQAYLTKISYELSPKWSLALDAGLVPGHDGSSSTFKAVYLNPNFHVSNLLFRYNLMAIGDSNYNIYDAYLTNVRYLKLSGQYITEQFKWNVGLIYATANETAKVGASFDHLRNQNYTSASTQDQNYGIELDVNGDYSWGPNSKLTFEFGYLFTGDYYKYASTAGVDESVKNSYSLSSKFLVSF